MNLKKAKGFTLIELVVVLVILTLLAAVAVSVYRDLQRAAERASAEGVAAALAAGMLHVRTQWMLRGAPGDGNTSRVDLTIDGIPVRFRNGFPVTTNNSAHVPAGTPNRGSAAARLFFLFLDSAPEVVARNSFDSGWAMLANGSCAAVARRRCWEYRSGGQRRVRVTYSGATGEFIVD